MLNSMTSYDIYFILFLASVLVILGFIMFKDGPTKRLNSIIRKYRSQVLVLINKDNSSSNYILTTEERKRILSISDNDWEEWNKLREKIKSLALRHPDTVNDFINEYIPKAKDREFYKNRTKLFTPIPQKIATSIDAMLLDELRLIDADSEEIWSQRDLIRQNAITIIQKYPEGYRTFCEVQQNSSPQYTTIVRDKNNIAELQTVYDNCKGYNGWEEKQEEFCTKFWQILKEVRSEDGRYFYNVSFRKPTRRGSLVESTFKIWQGFCEDFCSHLQDRQTGIFRKNLDELALLKDRTVYYNDRVYDEIFEIITKFDNEVEGDLYVIFIDKSKLNWPKETYDYHYKHLRDVIDDSDIKRIDYCELPNFSDNGNIGGIFVFDFITSNEELKENCQMIIEQFNKSVPLMGYYTMEKEYDEKELLELDHYLIKEITEDTDSQQRSDDDQGETEKEDTESKQSLDDDQGENEEEGIAFIRMCLAKIRKHSFYTYTAIPNTWIGEAAGAQETKQQWLDQADKYVLKLIDKPGFIAGEYSTDGGDIFYEISVHGSSRNIDDTAKFTYYLLKKMGVFTIFKQNGHKAIEYMNRRGLLAHH